MLYTIFSVGETEYKCRLNTKGLIELEKKLGSNPLGIFLNVSNNELPKLSDLMFVLHASLQSYNHGISLDDTYSIYDTYIEEGNTFMDFIPVVMDIYKVSGLFQEEKTAEDSGKN